MQFNFLLYCIHIMLFPAEVRDVTVCDCVLYFTNVEFLIICEQGEEDVTH